MVGTEVLDLTGTETLENLIKEVADPGRGMKATVINVEITEEKILQKMKEVKEAIKDQHIEKVCPPSTGESNGQSLVNMIAQVDKNYETRETTVHLRTVSVLLKEVLSDITERQNHLMKEFIRETDHTEVGRVKERDLDQLRGTDQGKNMKGDLNILQEETKGMYQILKDLALIDRDSVMVKRSFV